MPRDAWNIRGVASIYKGETDVNTLSKSVRTYNMDAANRRLAREKIFTTGADDTSAIVLTYNGSPRRNRVYSAECPCCYLGFGHTLAYHDQALAGKAVS